MPSTKSQKSPKTVLPDNPLHKFTSYSTYYTIKIGRNYSGKVNNVIKGGQNAEENILLLDTRGRSQGGIDNRHPQLNVKYFDVMHFFNHGPEAVFGLDATLRIFERGGATYLQTLGEIMVELEISSIAELVLWVGIGIYGWENQDRGTFNGVPITQKWFPMHIKKIDMELNAAGAEYVHWLIGWAYHRTNDQQSQHINNIGTCGRTINEHLIQLMAFANKNIVKTREEQSKSPENIPPGQPRDIFKTIIYKFDFEEAEDGSLIEKGAVVESDVTTQNTGGVVDIYSGGESGETTIVNHIVKILEYSPTVSRSLKAKNQWYKIIPRTELTKESETITYTIIPYQLDSKGLLPLKRFTYFFGGRNEDVIEFKFSMDGLFRILTSNLITNTRNSVEPDNSDTAQKAEGNQIKGSQAKVTDDSGTGRTSESKVGSPNRRNVKIQGGYTTLKNKRVGAYRNISRDSQNVQLNLLDNVETFVGNKILEGGFKIIGDPNLILDEVTVEELKKAGAPLESAVNYITFDVGTPNPEFPEIPSTDNFLFSGYYGIRTLKSIWGEDGTFVQEINVFWRSDLSEIAGGQENKAPDSDIDLETLGE